MPHKENTTSSNRGGPSIGRFIYDLLADILRYLFSTVGFMFSGAIVGAVLGAGGALYAGFPLGAGLLLGAVVGFAVVTLALVLVHGGW